MSRDCYEEEEISEELIQELLLDYSGYVLDLESLSEYDRASMTHFIDRTRARQPRLHITFPLDVTNIHRTFVSKATTKDTFTGYLTWGLIASMRLHPYLSFRYINRTWYAFDDLPLFIPITSGLAGNRFVSVVLKHIAKSDWSCFSSSYRSAVEHARKNWANPFAEVLHWSNYHFIGNIPDIQFTSLIIHESGLETSRPIFYFGHRYDYKDKLFVPFAIQFHHATFDPVRISDFISDFNKILTE